MAGRDLNDIPACEEARLERPCSLAIHEVSRFQTISLGPYDQIDEESSAARLIGSASSPSPPPENSDELERVDSDVGNEIQESVAGQFLSLRVRCGPLLIWLS
jgi:hypothetical protein